MKGIQLDCNILPSMGNIVTSPTYLVLIGWKDLSVSYVMFFLSVEKFVSRDSCFCLFYWKVLSVLSGMSVNPVYSWG